MPGVTFRPLYAVYRYPAQDTQFSSPPRELRLTTDAFYAAVSLAKAIEDAGWATAGIEITNWKEYDLWDQSARSK